MILNFLKNQNKFKNNSEIIIDSEDPTAPNSLVASNATASTIDLAWSASTDNVGVSFYRVYNNDVLFLASTGNVTSYQLTGLTESTEYNLTVRAVDSSGNESINSNLQTISTISSTDITAPTAPTSLISSNIAQTSFDLSWTASTDNVGVTDYVIYNNDVLLVASTSGLTNYSLSGLSANTAYVITVRARDLAGNTSVNSVVENVTTLAVPSGTDYTLTSAKSVSSGVYDANDNLLRELETMTVKQAGTYNAPTWDGLDNEGNNVSAQGDHYKIVANAITDTWEGVIGNTSSSFTGKNIHKEYHFYREMLIHSDTMYLASGYTESAGSIVAASLSDMGTKLLIMPGYLQQQNTDRIATDGISMYSSGCSAGNADGFNADTSYLQGVLLSELTPEETVHPRQWLEYYTFQGDTHQIFGSTFKVTDKVVTPGQVIETTGLAVQVSANNLFLAREELNSLKVIDKRANQGNVLQNYTNYLAPKHCKVDGSDNLWFIHDVGGTETIEKFTVNASTGALTSTGFTITGNNITAMAFNADYSILAVADIDVNGDHRVHGYNTTTGAESWILGRAENYLESPIVYNDKFLFKDKWDDPQTYNSLAFENDGSLWVMDQGNKRWIKFNPSRVWEAEYMWLDASLSCQVDPNNNTEVYSEHLEFIVDYSLPMQPNNANQAWRLLRNYVETSFSNGATKGILDITTLSNGKTYGITDHLTISDRNIIVELTDTGYRDTGVFIDRVLGANMKPDGTLYFKNPYEGGGITSILKQTLTGFDGSSNPIYTPKVEISRLPPSSPIVSGSPGGDMLGEFLSDGKMVVFQGFRQGAGTYHLGVLDFVAGNITTDFVWKTAKEVVYAPGSPYPLDGTFDGRLSSLRPASKALVIDDMIVWNYFGEFWENLQTNKYHMVNKDGLQLKVFGVASPNRSDVLDGAAGYAGNAHNPKVTKVGNDIYLWHNDASHHGGVHRWKLSNLDSIEEFIVPII